MADLNAKDKMSWKVRLGTCRSPPQHSLMQRNDFIALLVMLQSAFLMPLLVIHECLNILMNMLFTVIKSESAIKLIEQCNQESHNSNLSLLSILSSKHRIPGHLNSLQSVDVAYKYPLAANDDRIQVNIYKSVCMFVYIMLQWCD